MILMISSHGDTLQSEPSLRFGRAPYFIEFNLEDDSWKAHENPAVSESGGAGVAASQFLIDKKASAALSGRFGPNAHYALTHANIRMITFDGDYRTVQSVIDAYKDEKLQEAEH